MFKNNKAIIRDVGFILIIFFTFLTGLIFAKIIWYHVNDLGYQQLDFVDNSTKENIDDIGNALDFLDRIAPFFFLSLWLLTIFTSITVRPEHPVFYLLSIGLLLMFTLISILFVDLGTLILENTVFAPIIDDIGNTRFFIGNYHYIGFGIMLVSIIIFFRRTKLADGVGLQ